MAITVGGVSIDLTSNAAIVVREMERAARATRELDLQSDPLVLNDRCRVAADGMQWIVQKRRNSGVWEGVIFCQTKADLIANIGFEVFRGRGSRSTCPQQAEIGVAGASAVRPGLHRS